MLALLARQERLQKLDLDSISFFPSLLISISRGDCRYLQKLWLRPGHYHGDFPLLEVSQVMPLAGLIAVGKLSDLQELYFQIRWEKGAVAVLADGLRHGACPKMESLGCFVFPSVGVGHRGEEQTDGSMEALAELVQSRRNLPGCSVVNFWIG